MGFRLERKKTNTAPYVLIDEEKGYMQIAGECYLEDILAFFKDISEWLEKYLSSGFESFTFDCALEYFNSSTTKLLYNMLRTMDKYSQGDKKVVVNWIAAKDDDMIIECGEDFQEEMENLEFNLVLND